MTIINNNKKKSSGINELDKQESNEVASLGRYAKSATTCDDQDTKKDDQDRDFRYRALRAERYKLQNVARQWLYGEGVKQGLKHPANFHRTAQCLFLPNGQGVGLSKSNTTQRAFYTGLQTCGSVWSCPVCTAKIQEKRRVEIGKAVDYFYNNKSQAVLLTFTIKHKIFDSLELNQELFLDGLRKLRSGNQWTLFKKRHGFKGLIRSLEHTYGSNGWHPHTHELWFCDSDINEKEFIDFVKKRWLKICKKNGIVATTKEEKAFLEHSIDIKFNCRASDYLAKQDKSSHWGVDSEISKSARKSNHPFSFLNNEDDENSRRLFLEYVKATKGKAQIFWSRGLKDLVGVEDKTDEEIAEEENELIFLMKILKDDDWKIIVTLKKRSELLDIAETKDIDFINQYIEDLKRSLPGERQPLAGWYSE